MSARLTKSFMDALIHPAIVTGLIIGNFSNLLVFLLTIFGLARFEDMLKTTVPLTGVINFLILFIFISSAIGKRRK